MKLGLEFFYRGFAVGTLRVLRYPKTDGKYSYVAYRGPGHYKLMERLREKEIAVCYYITKNDRKVFFSVAKPVEYGKLVLNNINNEENLRHLIDEAVSDQNFF